jgi:glycosyltransferase involved in cell wall biosynthesis
MTQLSAVLRKAGVEVSVVSSDAPRAAEAGDLPFMWHAIGPGHLRYSYNPRLLKWLRAYRSGYDSVIVNGLWQYHSLCTWLALRNSPVPYFVFPHGMLDPWFKWNHRLKHIKKWMYWAWAEYQVLRDAACVLFTCEEERRRARTSFGFYSHREQVVGFGTAEPAGDSVEAAAAFLERFPLLRQKQLFLFLSRLHPIKGCDVLISAFGRFLEGRGWGGPSAPQEHLVIAGPCASGRYLKCLKRLAASLLPAGSYTFTGMLDQELRLGALRAAEVLVHPSHFESFGLSVVEALACGLPVLISNKVSIWRELDLDGACLVDEDDAAGTYRLLRRYSEVDGRRRRELRASALGCFRRRFEISSVGDRLLGTLRRFTPGCMPQRDG